MYSTTCDFRDCAHCRETFCPKEAKKEMDAELVFENRLTYAESTESWLQLCNFDCPECHFREECEHLNDEGVDD